jgi:hypothetical protein
MFISASPTAILYVCHEDAKASRKQCKSQISKCKLQNDGMALGHNLILLHFDFCILHSAFCIRQALSRGASVVIFSALWLTSVSPLP